LDLRFSEDNFDRSGCIPQLSVIRACACLGSRCGCVLIDSPATGRGSREELPRTPYWELSERELAVLRLMESKLSQREIAAELYVSFNTVKTHTRAIFRKLGVASRAEAVARARELGLL